MQDLVRLNTPRAVETESRRALRQLLKGAEKGMESAISSLVKLKGVGAATASGDNPSPNPWLSLDFSIQLSSVRIGYEDISGMLIPYALAVRLRGIYSCVRAG